MPKKKSAHKIPLDEVVHFRPGKFLGGLIAEFSETWQVSRGEATKRLVTLAVRGFTIESHDAMNELAGYTTCEFGQACELAYAEVQIEIRQRPESAGIRLNADERSTVVQRLVERYRILHAPPQDEIEERRQKIKQFRK